MGDAHTDLARSAEREEIIIDYHNRLAQYFIDRTEESYSSLKETIGYMISEGILKREVDSEIYIGNRVEELDNNNELAWMNLLHAGIGEELYQRLLESSPFEGRVFVDYRMLSGSVVPCNVVAHDLEVLVRKKMKDEGYDFDKFNGDRFSLAVPKELLERIVNEGRIVWRGSSCSNIHPLERD